MIQLCFSVAIRIEDAVIDDPTLLRLLVEIDTIDDTNTTNDAMSITTVLTSYSFDIVREIFVSDGVIEENKAVTTRNDIGFDQLPNQSRSELFSTEITVD